MRGLLESKVGVLTRWGLARAALLVTGALVLSACETGRPMPLPLGTPESSRVTPAADTPSTGSAAASGRRDLVTASDETDLAKRARIRVELAGAYFSQGQYATALDEVKRALAVDPNHVPALNLRGLIYASMGEYELAEESFRAALKLRSGDADTMHNYGWYLCQRRRFPEARQQFEAVMGVPQYRDQARTLLAAGICEARAGEMATAQVILQRSFEMDPSSPAATFNLADVLWRRENYERAFFYIQRLNKVPELQSAESLWLAIRIQHRRNLSESVEELGGLLRSRFPKSREAAAYERGQFDE